MSLDEYSILTFLKIRQVKKGEAYTHTCIGAPFGSYNIPLEDKPEMIQLLAKHLFEDNGKIGLTECQQTITPIKIDLDFKYPMHDVRRRHTTQTIKDIVQLYHQAIQHHLKALKPDDLTAFVFERNAPYVAKGNCKDGIHIMYPSIACNTQIQHLIREYVLKQCEPIFKPLETKNNLEDIIDHSVVSINNWLMFGCSKPDCTPYQLTHVLNSDLQDEADEYGNTMSESIELFSIRDYDLNAIYHPKDELPIKPKTNKITHQTPKNLNYQEQPLNERWLNALKASPYWQDHFQVIETNSQHMKLQAQTAYNCLLCEREHINNKNHPLIFENSTGIWFYCRDGHKTCLQSNSLPAGVCKLDSESPPPIPQPTISKLKVKVKSPEAQLNALIQAGLSGLEEDLARLLHHIFQTEWKFVSENQWYQFHSHRWHDDPKGLQLRKMIPSQLRDFYVQRHQEAELKAKQLRKTCSLANDSMDNKTLLKVVTKAKLATNDPSLQALEKVLIELDLNHQVMAKLHTTKMMNAILTEASKYFLHREFGDVLDSKTHLIGFENGVYDLNLGAFRDGHSDDLISLSTKTNYMEFEDTDEQLQIMIDSFKKIYLIPTEPEAEQATKWDFMLQFLASCLNGNLYNQFFTIFSGVGGNGKSVIINMMMSALGGYARKGSIKILTDTKQSTSYELATYRGVRLLTFAEPNHDAKFDVGLIKDLTGGEEISARQIYEIPFTYKPQFHVIMSTNHDPDIPHDDGGIWRRALLIKHPARFLASPNPENPYEYPMDLTIADKILLWRERFMFLLLQQHKIFKTNLYKLNIPQSIKDDINQFKGDQEDEHTSAFLTQYITDSNPLGVLTLAQAWDAYKNSTQFEQTDKNKRLKKKDLKKVICGFNGVQICSPQLRLNGTLYKNAYRGLSLIPEPEPQPQPKPESHI